MDIASSSGVSMSSTSLASSADTEDRLSVSSHSTLDPPRPLAGAALRRLRPKRPLPRQQGQQQQQQGAGGASGGGGSAMGRPGKRWKRRQLNESYLHSLATVAEVTEEDVTGCQCPESPFSALFLDPGRMLAWRQFAELSDDQQLEFLASRGEADAVAAADAESEAELLEDPELKAMVVEPARRGLPASGAWGRLSATCRDFALRRAVPGSRWHAELAGLEAELRDLFRDGCAPWADWVSGARLPCDRLVVHCAAGYLGLQSASEDAGPLTAGSLCAATPRCVCVRRWPGRAFRPPAVSLTAHLAALRLRRERQLSRCLGFS